MKAASSRRSNPSPEGKRKTGRPLSFDRDVALRQAMLTFWRHGYEATSLSDLTAAMGVTAPSIYAAYRDKKQLFLEAARLYAGPLEALEQALFDAPTARAAARAMLLSSAAAFTADDTPKGCLLASATASVSKEAVDVQAAISGIRRQIQAAVARRIRQDIDQGILPGETDETALSSMLIALIQGMSVLARDGTERAGLIAMVEAALNAWPAETAGR